MTFLTFGQVVILILLIVTWGGLIILFQCQFAKTRKELRLLSDELKRSRYWSPNS